MRKRILIVSEELPPLRGRAVTGAGLRMHGIAEGLKLRGHSVRYAVSRKRVLEERNLPGYLKEFSYTRSTLHAVIKRASPDYVLKIWWGGEDSALAKSPVPVIFDLPAPRLLENLFHNRSCLCDLDVKIDSFRTGTFFTCPSLLHKAYYLPILMMSGFAEKEGLIEVMPHAIFPEPEPEPMERDRAGSLFIFGGVFWPWQNPVNGLNSVIKAIDRRNSGRLKVITGPLPYNDGARREYLDPVPLLTSSDRLSLSPLLPYSDMKEEFSKALVGVDIMRKNSERELSFSFRTLEYLSCGLPVITGSSGEWAGYIKEYNAGWVVDPEDTDRIEEIVDNILRCPDIAKERSVNARRLVKEVFAPESRVEPLDRFLETGAGKIPGKNALNELVMIKSSEMLADAGFKESSAIPSENNGSHEWLHYRRGAVLMKLKEFPAALDEFEKEEIFFPGKAENLRMSGVVCKEMKMYENAMVFFEKAEKTDPLLEWTHLERGLTYCLADDFKKAFDEIAKEEELYPGKGETSQAKGIIAVRCGEHDRAILLFRRAIERDCRLLAAQYNLASLLSVSGNRKESVLLFQKIADDADASASLRAGCFFHLAKILSDQKKTVDARKHLCTCLDLLPEHREARKLLDGIQ